MEMLAYIPNNKKRCPGFPYLHNTYKYQVITFFNHEVPSLGLMVLLEVPILVNLSPFMMCCPVKFDDGGERRQESVRRLEYYVIDISQFDDGDERRQESV
jgi:hypothetical protein